MKVKQALATLFSDAEISLGAKTEVVTFLRRYSSPTRPCTHYSCRGRVTAVLKKLLELLEFEEGKDYNVVSSSFDPEFNQIRWTSNRYKINALTSLFTTLCRAYPSYFDSLYLRITKREDLTALIECIPNIDIYGNIVIPTTTSTNHLAFSIANNTRSIVSSLQKFIDEMTDDKYADYEKKFRNFKVAYESAKEFIKKNYSDEGNPIAGVESPYILPVSVLELYTRLLGRIASAPAVGGNYNALIFCTDEQCIDLFRLFRSDEKIMWHACMNAPLSYLWNSIDEESSHSEFKENTLKSYFFRTADKATTASLDDKCGVFIGGNAALICKEGDDLITPALCLHYKNEFWGYVLSIYKSAYGLESGLTASSRIGITGSLPVWSRTPDSARTSVLTHEACWNSYYTGDASSSDNITTKGCPIIAEYGIFLANKITQSYSDVNQFIYNSTRPLRVTQKSSEGAPDFTDRYLSKDELGWELFFMSHMDSKAGDYENESYIYRRTPDDPSAIENLRTMRSRISSMSQSEMARLSSCMTNSSFIAAGDGYGDNMYTPLSAFIDGVCVELRKANSHDGSEQPALINVDVSESNNILLTNIYSGMFTGLSPRIGDENDTGEVFPNPHILGSEGTGISNTSEETDKDKESLTKFLARLKSGSFEQVKFAKREPGTKRYGTIVVETNLDAHKLLDRNDVNLSDLETALGTVFIQTLVIGRKDPFCAFDNSRRRDSSCYTIYSDHSRMASCSASFWHQFAFSKNTSEGPEAYALPSGLYGNGGYMKSHVNVFSRCDSNGRLVLFFVVSGDVLAYARYVYRFRSHFPMETAYIKTKLYETNGTSDFLIANNEWGDESRRNILVGKIIGFGANDYHGFSDYSESSCSIGVLFRGPVEELAIEDYEKGIARTSRRWFLQFTDDLCGRLSCCDVLRV